MRPRGKVRRDLGGRVLWLRRRTAPWPWVVSNNWDRFGARVHGLLNARSCADQCGRPFRFVWPAREEFPEIARQLDFFSAAFVAQHRVDAEALTSLRRASLARFYRSALPVGRQRPMAGRFVRVSHRFDVFAFPGQRRADARRAFARALPDGALAPAVAELRREVRAAVAAVGGPLCVLHLRFGDLVSGEWRQYVPPSKFVPAASARLLIDRLRGDGWRIAVVTDSPEALALLDASPCVGGALERRPEEDPDRQMYTDLFLMSAAERVIAPGKSAFSRLGAHLGARETVDALESLSVADHRGALRRLLTGPGSPPGSFAANCAAREVYRLLGELLADATLSELTAGIDGAVRYDPGYVQALATSALLHAAAGRTGVASERARDAVAAARAVTVHADPLVLALTAVVVVRAAAVRAGGGSEALAEAEASLVELTGLAPHQIDRRVTVREAERWVGAARLWSTPSRPPSPELGPLSPLASGDAREREPFLTILRRIGRRLPRG